MPPASDVVRAGDELVLAKDGRWLTPGDVVGPLVVLVHGFTSHGKNFARMADYLGRYGFVAALFNYDSYRGIDAAAERFLSRLTPLASAVSLHGIYFVAHSMGGLVCRYLYHRLPVSLRSSLGGIAMLGTPNKGTLIPDSRMRRRFISMMFDLNDLMNYGDNFMGIHPYRRNINCLSAEQLTRRDKARLVDTLNSKEQNEPIKVPVLTVSGGQEFLEFGDKGGKLSEKMKNALLQGMVDEETNDGLVGETSANYSRALGVDVGNAQHKGEGDYPDWPDINHTNLTQNQGVAEIVVLWLQSLRQPGDTAEL